MGRAEEVLRGLASLREEDILCDVQLQAEGQHISAHKAVLAAASPYFKAMFSGNFREMKEHVVTMKEVSFIGLRSVVGSIYTTQMSSLNIETIEHVFSVADLLQINSIVEECIEWIGENINKTNWFQFLEKVEDFNNDNVEQSVNSFILQNFADVSQTKDFENISKPVLIKYLASDILNTNVDEFVVYKAARKWILANDIPSEGVFVIISHVRFGLIEPDQFMKEILYDPSIERTTDCQEMVDNALQYHTNVYTQALYEGTMNKPRGKAGLLVIPSYRNTTEGVINMEFLSFPRLKTLSDLISWDGKNVPDDWSSISSTQINNSLYIFGVRKEGCQNFAKRYDASTDRWVELASGLRPPVMGAAIACTGRQIFLLGGMHVHSYNVVNWMYVYDISQNSWESSTDLPTGLQHASAIKHQENIYLTGGTFQMYDYVTSSKVWAYDMKAQVWLTKAPMNHKRTEHALQAVNDKLYVLGGRKCSNDSGEQPNSIEMYDSLANQWTVLLDNVLETPTCSSFVKGNKVYLTGEGQVCVYDIETNNVSILEGRFPSLFAKYSTTAFMILPKLL